MLKSTRLHATSLFAPGDSFAILLAACVLSIHAGAARAQEPCGLQATKHANLSQQADGGGSFPLALTSLSQDRWAVVFLGSEEHLTVFEADGSLSAFPRSGPTPEEATFMRVHPWTGDSIAAWDFANRRLHVWPADLGKGRTLNVDIRPRDLVLTEAGLILHAMPRTRTSAGYPYHRVASSGRLLDSFGSDGAFRADRPSRYERRITPAAAGGFWAAHTATNLIELWSPENELLRELVPELQHSPSTGTGAVTVQDIREDEEGLLWVMLRVADPDWQTDIRTIADLLADAAVRLAEDNARWDTVVSIVDPNTSQELASTRFDRALLGWVDGSSLAYVYPGEDTEGNRTLHSFDILALEKVQCRSD